MKSVIRAPNWIGDAILSLPAIQSFRQNFPSSKIWIAARGWVKDLFLGFDFIDGVLSLPDTMDLSSIRLSAKMLRSHRFDTGLLLTNSFSSALVFFIAGIPNRWGYSRDGRGILLTKRPKVEKKERMVHQVQYYQDLISGLGLTTFEKDQKLFMPLDPDAEKKAKNLLLSLNVNLKSRLIILNPGAYYGSAKRWPLESFAQLASSLQKNQKAEIVIIGSSSEIKLAETISDLMSEKPHILSGKTSLPELSSVLRRADLVISNDSGPMHMANALQVPLIAIFGPTDPTQTGPYQKPSVTLWKKVSCWPCDHRECPTDHKCMTGITPEEVYDHCLRLLQ